MNRSICWLTLDMNRRDGQCSVSLGQGETGRTLKFRLYENGAPYTIPEGCYVMISGVMDNNHDGVSESVIYNDCYIQDGVVCYDITDATALGTVGVMNCQLQIMSVDGGCVCSPKFQIVVHSAVYDKETVEGSEQFFALQKILEGLSQGGGSTGGSSGGGALPLSGKNILIFGSDYDGYDYFIAEIERITGAKVYNLAIRGTTCEAKPAMSGLELAFSLTMMFYYNSSLQGDFSLQETAISEANKNGIDTTRYEEVLALLKDFVNSEINPDFVIFSYGKNAWCNDIPISNPSSSSDTSTYIGSIQYAINSFQLKFYGKSLPVLMTEHNTQWQGMEMKDATNGNGVPFSEFVEALVKLADDGDYQLINLAKNSGMGWGIYSFLQGYDENGIYFVGQKPQETLARIVTRMLC